MGNEVRKYLENIDVLLMFHGFRTRNFDFREIVQRFALALFSLDISTTRRRDLSARRRHLNEALDTWMENHEDECDWYTSYYNNFVPCDKTGVFRHLVLINVQLDGTLPTELGLLTRLSKFISN